MIYLYDNAIVDDLNRSFNSTNVGQPLVKVTTPEESIGLAAQIQNDNIQFPIVALNRCDDLSIDQNLWNFTRLHSGVSCVFDKETNTFYDEKAIPVSLWYNLTVLTTRIADMDEIMKELLFKYGNEYFITIQLPYESNRHIRFGVKINNDAGIKRESFQSQYSENGKLHQSIIRLDCDGAVLVSYTPVKLRKMSHDIEAVYPGQILD